MLGEVDPQLGRDLEGLVGRHFVDSSKIRDPSG